MTKLQWTLVTVSGLIFIVGANIWAAKRDYKMLSSPPQSEAPVYQRIQVIPFTN